MAAIACALLPELMLKNHRRVRIPIWYSAKNRARNPRPERHSAPVRNQSAVHGACVYIVIQIGMELSSTVYVNKRVFDYI